MIQRIFPIGILLFCMVIFQQCGKDDPAPTELIPLEAFLTQNNISPEYTSSGLGYIIANAGGDRKPNSETTVQVDVVVKTTDNAIAIDTEGDIYVNLFDQVIGLKEGIQLIGEGGIITLYVPYEIGWGASGNSSIPALADIIIDVTVTSVLQTIEEYIEDNNIMSTVTLNSGVQVLIEEIGDGDFPTSTSNVSAIYKGYYTNDDQFDSSAGEPIDFNLSGVIAGWTEGMQKFDRGAKGKLFIPYESAYGSSGFQNIPGRTDLIFDIELVDF